MRTQPTATLMHEGTALFSLLKAAMNAADKSYELQAQRGFQASSITLCCLMHPHVFLLVGLGEALHQRVSHLLSVDMVLWGFIWGSLSHSVL